MKYQSKLCSLLWRNKELNSLVDCCQSTKLFSSLSVFRYHNITTCLGTNYKPRQTLCIQMFPFSMKLRWKNSNRCHHKPESTCFDRHCYCQSLGALGWSILVTILAAFYIHIYWTYQYLIDYTAQCKLWFTATCSYNLYQIKLFFKSDFSSFGCYINFLFNFYTG